MLHSVSSVSKISVVYGTIVAIISSIDRFHCHGTKINKLKTIQWKKQ